MLQFLRDEIQVYNLNSKLIVASESFKVSSEIKLYFAIWLKEQHYVYFLVPIQDFDLDVGL